MTKKSLRNTPPSLTPTFGKDTSAFVARTDHNNNRPSEDMPELEPAFLNMGKLVVSVGEL